jgi:hypothetical protein
VRQAKYERPWLESSNAAAPLLVARAADGGGTTYRALIGGVTASPSARRGYFNEQKGRGVVGRGRGQARSARTVAVCARKRFEAL